MKDVRKEEEEKEEQKDQDATHITTVSLAKRRRQRIKSGTSMLTRWITMTISRRRRNIMAFRSIKTEIKVRMQTP